MSDTTKHDFFNTQVLGHPAGLFVLFFTEMWERFSYYGMRSLLVLFFTASILDEGWGWPKEHAFAIFGTYTSLVYLSTMLGGYFADNIIGFRWAVVVGALLMTLGHGAMAIETPFFIYVGLTLLVFGTGFFKPNMVSIISEVYKNVPEKKDGAYTIFYMGVNSGAFFGIMLCGYLGEKIGWSWGFGVAGIFMLFGLLQFWFSQNIFGDIGKKPKKYLEDHVSKQIAEGNDQKKNPFTSVQLGLIVVAAILGLTWILNDPLNKITEGAQNIYNFSIGGIEGNSLVIIGALLLFIVVLVLRLPKYLPVVRDRMLAVIFFAFITIFFWAIFEQSPGSLTLFARDYTQRVLEGTFGTLFKVVDALITLIPLAIISYVLIQLCKKTFSKYALSNIILSLSFVIIWGIAGWKVYNDYKSASYDIVYEDNNGNQQHEKVITYIEYEPGEHIPIIDNEQLSFHQAKPDELTYVKDNVLYNETHQSIGESFRATIDRIFEQDKIGAGIQNSYAEVSFKNRKGEIIKKTIKLSMKEKKTLRQGDQQTIRVIHHVNYDNKGSNSQRAVVKAKENAVEIGATWFSILNSLFIITLAPLFSRWWGSKYSPNANAKYAIGMLFLAIGMAAVAVGASGIPAGAKTASVSLIWLVLVYLFHTMGELCISPVSLSYVSKLVPGRMIAIMFGIWYLAVAIGMKMAGMLGEFSEKVSREYGLGTFFWILTIISLVLSGLALLMSPVIKRLMHGIK